MEKLKQLFKNLKYLMNNDINVYTFSISGTKLTGLLKNRNNGI